VPSTAHTVIVAAVVWQVLARICVATRPALTLAEVMSQEQLEQLILLAVHHDNSQGPSVWGGPWASHAITCLLQDILEGKWLSRLDEI